MEKAPDFFFAFDLEQGTKIIRRVCWCSPEMRAAAVRWAINLIITDATYDTNLYGLYVVSLSASTPSSLFLFISLSSFSSRLFLFLGCCCSHPNHSS
jgi:hypothetical protein